MNMLGSRRAKPQQAYVIVCGNEKGGSGNRDNSNEDEGNYPDYNIPLHLETTLCLSMPIGIETSIYT